MDREIFQNDSAEWETPQEWFNNLNSVYQFTLDPCASPENAKCRKFYTKEKDGLSQDWGHEIVYCNPPYGRGIEKWVKKCYEHYLKGGTAVMLLPARTDTKWFHDYVYKEARIAFLKGRMKFSNAKYNAPFPSMLVIYDNTPF